ncbi:MAG: DNA repair protein RecN [Coriobacteriales bacterium]|jgi:DNA repair protein RecN (Recombination protein N)
MIEELHVSNLALIESATLEFSPGLTVLTGETGTGKTALLGAIKLIIGSRADASSVRDGQREAVVEALFSVNAEQETALAEQGLEAADGQLVARRRLSADGRSRCYLNGGMATVGALEASVGSLVELHGQHEHQRLLTPRSHRLFLDAWGDEAISPLREGYAAAFDAWRVASDRLAEARDSARLTSEKLEEARFLCAQVEAVGPQPGELDELEARLPILRDGESLARSAAEALAIMRSEGGALELLGSARRALARGEGTDPRLDALGERLEGQLADIEDLALELRSYGEQVEFDPEALAAALERLGQLDGLVRRFGPTYDEMLSRWEEAQRLVALHDDEAGMLGRLERAADEAARNLQAAAAALEDARRETATAFCAELGVRVAELAMTGASFEMSCTELEMGQWTRDASCRYELLYAPAPTVAPRPLARIASGGELSRVMLALECMVDADEGAVLVFDEVDAGIGGATARAVADLIERLAATRQVIVVTHLAQIATRADAHLLVERHDDGETARTVIRPIDGEERVAEIARMLSGSVDDESLAHARMMLGR